MLVSAARVGIRASACYLAQAMSTVALKIGVTQYAGVI
jgi:hypothetical protein